MLSAGPLSTTSEPLSNLLNDTVVKVWKCHLIQNLTLFPVSHSGKVKNQFGATRTVTFVDVIPETGKPARVVKHNIFAGQVSLGSRLHTVFLQLKRVEAQVLFNALPPYQLFLRAKHLWIYLSFEWHS